MRCLIVCLALLGCSKGSKSSAPPKNSPPDEKLDLPGWKDPPKESGPARATQISLGRDHACARMSDDTMRCWGQNDWGQLGTGDVLVKDRGVVIPKLDAVVEVAAGGTFTCARLRDRTVSCWGYNHVGQIGAPPSETSVTTPKRIDGITGAVALMAGEGHSCVVREDGAVWCWGQNTYYDLGDGKTTGVGPVAVVGLSSCDRVSGGSFTCAHRVDNTMWCWGSNHSDTATQLGPSSVAEVVVGGLNGCARMAGGTVQCWGANDSGQLARGDATDGKDKNYGVPGPVAQLTGVAAVTTADTFACAIVDGEVRCWGAEWANPSFPETCLKETDHSGGGGAPAQWNFCAVPTAVPGVRDAVAVDAAQQRACALTGAGEVFCWGDDKGVVRIAL